LVFFGITLLLCEDHALISLIENQNNQEPGGQAGISEFFADVCFSHKDTKRTKALCLTFTR